MTHVSLFSGIGGLDLAAEWAGFKTVLQVEMDDYATKVLEKHWPKAKRIRDVRDVNRETVSGAVTVVSGGFPCQPFSAAGKRGGRGDDRYLWPEMLRVIRELSPTWVVGENVAGLLSIDGGLEIESIITDLENEGYEVCPALYPAAGVGAPHKRDRVFIIANGQQGGRRSTKQKLPKRIRDVGKDIILDSVFPWKDIQPERKDGQTKRGVDYTPRAYRKNDGISDWVDRIKCLGNAVVPQQAYPIFKAIAEVEHERMSNMRR